MFKSGFVTIVGRPNAGKSTLINSIIGEKVAIVSSKPQTTRNCLKGVYTTSDYQIVFMDTPGMHNPRTKLGEYMMTSVKNALDGVDCVIVILDCEHDLKTSEEEILVAMQKSKVPVIVALNKIDTADKVRVLLLEERLKREFTEFDKVFKISAATGDGVKEMIDYVATKLPYGPMYFQEEYFTDQSERFMVSEIIREKALHLLRDEIPHGIGVEIEKIRKRKDRPTSINATIICEKKSHKGIIIGKNGAMLKEIGTQARVDIEELLGNKVYLEIWVKIRDEWRNDSNIMKQLGYHE
jgi:GTP-binding protein Era